jgi:hypothetical protein
VSQRTKKYTLELHSDKTKKIVTVEANDNNHAQAQSIDISRALCVDKFKLNYEINNIKQTKICSLFKKLAYSDFSHDECFEWEGSYTNGCPTVYLFGKRFYIRPLIIDYMNIKKDSIVKMECENKDCVNPYHFSYKTCKAQKMSSGDLKMMLAFAGQGVSVKQIAKALNIHRSTVYRNLNHERLHAGP